MESSLTIILLSLNPAKERPVVADGSSEGTAWSCSHGLDAGRVIAVVTRAAPMDGSKPGGHRCVWRWITA